MGKEQALSALNGLIQVCKDCEQGYRTASQGVEDYELKTVFNQYARQRQNFISELQTLVTKLGEKPSNNTGVAAFSGWANIKAAVNERDVYDILTECEKGEDTAAIIYDQMLKQGEIPPVLRTIIQRQYIQIREAQDRMRTLQNKHK